jgi:thiol-disulfide isomerase/thioredoxin
MLHRCVLAFLLVAVFIVGAAAAGDHKGNGFGDDYDWFTFDAGMAEAKETGKPAMLVFHKSWCGACKRLAPVFAASDELKSAADDFVLINVHDDEDKPLSDEWAPDGGSVLQPLHTICYLLLLFCFPARSRILLSLTIRLTRARAHEFITILRLSFLQVHSSRYFRRRCDGQGTAAIYERGIADQAQVLSPDRRLDPLVHEVGPQSERCWRRQRRALISKYSHQASL